VITIIKYVVTDMVVYVITIGLVIHRLR
jgi:hypothetical protein